MADENNLEEYWKHGAGAAKIRWGTKGSFTRCVAHIGKHVTPDAANRICAQWHFDTEGTWPGSHKKD